MPSILATIARRPPLLASGEGEYSATDHDDRAALVGQLGSASRRVVIATYTCQVHPESEFFGQLVTAAASARRDHGVTIQVYYNIDPHGSIAALAGETGSPAVVNATQVRGDLPFYGRVIDGVFIEVITRSKGICGPGPYLRTRDRILARSIEASLSQWAHQHGVIDPTDENATEAAAAS
jgi:hypothetical protein